MTRSQYEIACEAASYAARKIAVLQKGLLSAGHGSSVARASLARIRRSAMSDEGSWFLLGREIFGDMPELDLSARDERRFIETVSATLRLYAVHQQSKSEPMALLGKDDGKLAGKSFGWSCRTLVPNLDDASAVVERLAAAEAAPGLEGVEHYLRALVMLMRSCDRGAVRVDYWQLAHDLYLVQAEGARGRVFARWARDFYRAPDQKKEDSDNPEGE